MKKKKNNLLKKLEIFGGRKKLRIVAFNKRQRFIAAVLFLSVGLFLSEQLLGRSGIFLSIVLALLTPLFVYITNYDDINTNFSWNLFVLPFFYSLSFALFYFLVPPRFLTRVTMTSLYALGLYSLFLCNNIFTVASIRTIGLLASARTVSFVITLLSYFFLIRIMLSFHWHVAISAVIVFLFSFLLTIQSIWTYTLEKVTQGQILWTVALAACLTELFIVLWFWPSSPTIVAIFLAGFFYVVVGLSHVWFEKRLFRGVLWEYIWVSVVIFCILTVFTSWR